MPSPQRAAPLVWETEIQEAGEFSDQEPLPRYSHRRLLTGTELPPPRSFSPIMSTSSTTSHSPDRSRRPRRQHSSETIVINSTNLQPLSSGIPHFPPSSLPLTEPILTPMATSQHRPMDDDDDRDFDQDPQPEWQPRANEWSPHHSYNNSQNQPSTRSHYSHQSHHSHHSSSYEHSHHPQDYHRTGSPDYEYDESSRPLPGAPHYGADPHLSGEAPEYHISMPPPIHDRDYHQTYSDGLDVPDIHDGYSATSSHTYGSEPSPSPHNIYSPDDFNSYNDKNIGMDLEKGQTRRRLPVQPETGEGGDYPELNAPLSEIDEQYYYDDKSDGSPNMGHTGPIRQAQMTKKQVMLVNGQLVLDWKIPSVLYSFLPRRDAVEFTHMRYTAVTCDPDDYVGRGYQLRQQIDKRETELLICITMYNEDENHFTRTMHGVMENIAHFCSRARSRIWGRDGWQKIVVCIISDGRSKVHPRTLDALAALGVYQPGIAKNTVNKKQVQAHVYEYTTQVSLDADLRFRGAEKGIVPCQLIFCLKEQNLKKLNSHRWFFNAFGQSLNPNVCILLDVGTRPAPTALYHLWKAFDLDANVGGAAGEIVAGKGKHCRGLLNPLVASQNFEYKMSNILDKPLESVFGYITVLPGALSAYRYIALSNDETGHGPLSQYFKGETLHGEDADVFTANMYLAEDRILCWELIAKRNHKWLLKYVSSAKGETDVPDSVPEFISQRRRWLNGAFFAAVYSLLHFHQIWQTDHSIARKLLLHVEFLYQFIQLIFSFLSLANFYLTFYFIAGSLAEHQNDPFGHGIGNVIFIILRYGLILLICLQFILSMGNRPQGAHKMFLSSMIAYSVIMVYTVFAGLYITVTQLMNNNSEITIGQNIFTNIIVSLLSTVGLYFVMSFLYLDPWHMFTSSAQYFALLPSYICTLQIYAFCNAHDVSWGTKGDNGTSNDLGAAHGTSNVVELDVPSQQMDIDSGYDEALRNLRDRVQPPASPPNSTQAHEDYYRAVRTYMVIVWLFCNAVLAMSISELYGGRSIGNNVYLSIILWSVAGLALFRAIGSTTFGILNIIHSIAESRLKWSQRREPGGGSAVGGAGASSAVGTAIGANSNLTASSAYARARYGSGAKLGVVTRVKESFRGMVDNIRK